MQTGLLTNGRGNRTLKECPQRGTWGALPSGGLHINAACTHPLKFIVAVTAFYQPSFQLQVTWSCLLWVFSWDREVNVWMSHREYSSLEMEGGHVLMLSLGKLLSSSVQYSVSVGYSCVMSENRTAENCPKLCFGDAAEHVQPPSAFTVGHKAGSGVPPQEQSWTFSPSLQGAEHSAVMLVWGYRVIAPVCCQRMWKAEAQVASEKY